MGANRLFLFIVLCQPIITTAVEKTPSVASSSGQILKTMREVQMAEIMEKEVHDRNLNLRLYTVFRIMFRR